MILWIIPLLRSTLVWSTSKTEQNKTNEKHILEAWPVSKFNNNDSSLTHKTLKTNEEALWESDLHKMTAKP